jgi:CHAT domain-containing protein
MITVSTACRIAGFRHVIGTLWPIEDATAAHAAQLFYDALPDLDHADTAGVALHRATRTLRRERPDNPERWSQFIHIGQ